MNRLLCALIISISLAGSALAQSIITGRLLTPRTPGTEDLIPLTGVWAVASPEGSAGQAITFRTWETEPVGWFRLAGPAGNYTLAFSTPAHFMRPIVRTNLFVRDGETIDLAPRPYADYAVFHEGAWDSKPATDYYQTFTAKGTGLTSVGFRLVHDGVDGFGPGSQNLLVSIHRRGEGTPETWEQIGPTVPVLDVDSGGGKNYIWSAGFNSGEVPLTPGQIYAVHIRAEKKGNTFQAFWLPAEPTTRPSSPSTNSCYRLGRGTAGWTGNRLWMSIGTDGDGLLIPYNKRIQKQFVSLTKFARSWSQTYIAQGRGLACVILYAATSGVQPSMNRQRVLVRVREGGPDGPVVGIPKIAIGNANYTGDASWGAFLVAFAPGEVPVVPGKTYAIEAESIENLETLHGFVNIKGMKSDDKPGFNPYRRHERDPYDKGRAYLNGKQAMDYSLDMQIIEYEHAARDWRLAVEGTNLVAAGRWKAFAVDQATVHSQTADVAEPDRQFFRITGRTADGGWCQRIDNLNRQETYRLAARIRCSFAVDDKRQCLIGLDPTGQTEDPNATTIVWAKYPPVLGQWVDHVSEPIRPKRDSISVFLRARSTGPADFPFRADFAQVGLRRVASGVPMGESGE